ncbi:MAG: hypothetical protein BZY75_06570 [SAR202 cluster bacterium Io17-Chloro-G7]|nr:MAG: hypothetical protein BZY75_06570 [SAR202 cluster bacterium Io17-Chloro-G7]
MQTLRTRDVLRCILLNVPKGPNLACPSQCVTGDKPASNPILWKETLAQRRERVTVASWDGPRLAGLASARIRSGYRAWEIDRLFLAGNAGNSSPHDSPFYTAPLTRGEDTGDHIANPNTVALELLEQMARETGKLHAERVFLRLPVKSRIFVLARQAGYFPYYEETLMESGVSLEPQRPEPQHASQLVNLRESTPEDHFPLFQLYCAATPQPVRTAVGMTFDQWRDAQEPAGNRQSWVLKGDGRLLARLAISCCGQVKCGEVMAAPSNPELWSELVEWALNQGGMHRWLVPDYQDMVSRLLLRRQFRAVSSYSVMIRTVAAPVARLGMVTVEA